MPFSCCNIPQSPDGYYCIDHPKKGSCKVHFARCCNCDRPIIKLDAGLFNKDISYFRGKDAAVFLKEFPYAPLSKTYHAYKKDNSPNLHYMDGREAVTKENLQTCPIRRLSTGQRLKDPFESEFTTEFRLEEKRSDRKIVRKKLCVHV